MLETQARLLDAARLSMPEGHLPILRVPFAAAQPGPAGSPPTLDTSTHGMFDWLCPGGSLGYVAVSLQPCTLITLETAHPLQPGARTKTHPKNNYMPWVTLLHFFIFASCLAAPAQAFAASTSPSCGPCAAPHKPPPRADAAEFRAKAGSQRTLTNLPPTFRSASSYNTCCTWQTPRAQAR